MSPEGQNGQQPGKKATWLYLTMMNYSSCCNKDLNSKGGIALDDKCFRLYFKFGTHIIWFLFHVILFNMNQEGAMRTLCPKRDEEDK